MSKAKTPIVAVTGAGVKRHYTVMTLDLAGQEEALKIGKRMAAQTGSAVTVTDANGLVLATFAGAPKH
jgi:hypothetical protein